MRYTGSEEGLSDLYANLLASSMDAKTVEDAHPGFVEIIKQLTPDEAKLLKYISTAPLLPLITVRLNVGMRHGGSHDVITKLSYFGEEAGCQNLLLIPTYIDNLSRLGLTKVPDGRHYTAPTAYDKLLSHPKVSEYKTQIELTNKAFTEAKAKDPDAFALLVNQLPELSALLEGSHNQSVEIVKQFLQITDLGALFIKGCVKEHRKETAL